MLEFAKGIDGKASELLKAIKEAETGTEEKAAKNAYLQYFKKEVVKSKAFKDLSIFSSAFAKMLTDPLFRTALMEVIEFGFFRNKKDYGNTTTTEQTN